MKIDRSVGRYTISHERFCCLMNNLRSGLTTADARHTYINPRASKCKANLFVSQEVQNSNNRIYPNPPPSEEEGSPCAHSFLIPLTHSDRKKYRRFTCGIRWRSCVFLSEGGGRSCAPASSSRLKLHTLQSCVHAILVGSWCVCGWVGGRWVTF